MYSCDFLLLFLQYEVSIYILVNSQEPWHICSSFVTRAAFPSLQSPTIYIWGSQDKNWIPSFSEVSFFSAKETHVDHIIIQSYTRSVQNRSEGNCSSFTRACMCLFFLLADLMGGWVASDMFCETLTWQEYHSNTDGAFHWSAGAAFS